MFFFLKDAKVFFYIKNVELNVNTRIYFTTKLILSTVYTKLILSIVR